MWKRKCIVPSGPFRIGDIVETTIPNPEMHTGLMHAVMAGGPYVPGAAHRVPVDRFEMVWIQLVQSMGTECEHDKAYVNRAYLTDPPQYPWICRKCGREGVDTFDVLRDYGEYDRIRDQFRRSARPMTTKFPNERRRDS